MAPYRRDRPLTLPREGGSLDDLMSAWNASSRTGGSPFWRDPLRGAQRRRDAKAAALRASSPSRE